MLENKSVQVAVRVRPLVNSEISKGCKDILEIYSELEQLRVKNTDKAFTYNYVLGPNDDQEQLYNRCVKHLIGDIFNGYNLTILAYGQTGSGKTHSMGTAYNGEGDMGVIPRAIQDIFNYVRDNFSLDFTLTVSFMELYQEVLYDLLSDKPREQCVLDIREDGNKGILIPGLTEVPVESSADVLQILVKGSSGRATGATNMNAQSSRSHAIFSINLSMQSKTDQNENKTAKFHLVDLAGSERQKKTGAVGTTFKEGININKGLLVLGNVISALGDEKLQHGYIPYRDSNLTRLLKDSLGGNSITLMIACVSPADYNLEETLSTLRYADRARKIQNKPIINQDQKAAEINQLKKIIQQLKLQILGQGGEVCPGEIELLKKEVRDLREQNRQLTLRLSSILNTNTGLLEKIMILQNANEILHSKNCELKNEFNATIENISIGLDKNDTETVKENFNKLQRLRDQIAEITSEHKKAEIEIQNHEMDLPRNHNEQNEPEINKGQESYARTQMALNDELQQITKQLAMKEHLAKQIATNTQYMVDYTALAENEARIASLQKEKDELLQQLKNLQSQGASNKIAEQRRKRVQELEGQIHDLQKKIHGQARLIKLKEKDETRIKQLNAEIVQMKQMKVKLIRKMREEADKFRTWKTQRERELMKLKQQDQKKQNQIVKMTVMYNKQQNVLKRKVEEAVALNKRLKDALALRKTAQDLKNSGKVERVGQWIKQEVEVFVNLVEAEATLESLLEDRGTLQEQLDRLKEDSNTEESQIRAIEEDIELRSVQIQDLQQKILDSDEESKSKTRFDNIQTMAEAKTALKMLMEQAGEIKKSDVVSKSKLLELQANQAELTDKIASLENTVQVMEYKHADDISQLQKDYGEKVAVLLRQLRGVKVENVNEELAQRCAIQEDKIEELHGKINEYQDHIDELNEKLKTKLAQQANFPDPENGFKTPVDNKQKKQNKTKKLLDTTFVMGDQENADASFEEEGDDVEKDPDWRKTPLGKWIQQYKKKSVLGPAADNTNKTFKRTSDGGCMCQKSKCSSRCGCRKVNKNCTSGCKCAVDLCENRDDHDLESDNSSEIESKRANVVFSRKTGLFPQKLSYHPEK